VSTAEYVAEVLSDQHLSLPRRVRESLGLKPKDRVRVWITRESPDTAQASEAWQVFRALGRDAPAGRLTNAAEGHDRYLYGKKE
jgi:bifunctional DNA-binding transcriptional regulator/antitoxin component of YhaV-PrlF toxin-antitoxin module